MIDPAEFTAKIWHLQGKNEGAFGFVSKKNWDTGDWKDFATSSTDQLPDMDQDWYFSPCLFAGKRRLRGTARPSRVLYADLDEVDPRSIQDVPPTVGWETSPGRYQALWVLDRPLKLESFENLNRRLTYHVGADRGGWSSTKVLRIPGTTSTKYGKSRNKRFTVRIVSKGPRYTYHELHRVLTRELDVGTNGSTEKWGDIPEASDVLKRWRRKLPTKARQLLRTEAPSKGDDRSAVLYQLEGLLLAAGLSPEETLAVVRDSAWNKYQGQRREMQQLRREIRKHQEEHRAKEVEGMVGRIRSRAKTNGHDKKLVDKLAERQSREGLPSLSYTEFLDAHFPEPAWLVEGFWGLGAYGVWAGEFKAFKTVTLLDFALSVSSGQPFLGRFKVCQAGPVAYVHDEGTPGYIQDRLRRIAWQKGLAGGSPNGNRFEVEFPTDLPLRVSTAPRLNLTEEQSQERLIKFCGKYKPLVLILESFYLMAQDIDESSAREVTPALSFLKDLAQSQGTAVIVSHHYNKDASTADGKKRRAGLRMSGSSVFGRWYESAVYLEREGEDTEGRAMITAEHREQKGMGKQHLQVSMDTEDDVHYDVEIVDANVKMQPQEDISQILNQKDTLGHPKSPSPKEVSCPICKVPEGKYCKDTEGQKRGYHPSRRRKLESMSEFSG